MTTQTIRPMGSFLVIADDIYADMPEFHDGPSRLWANESCIGVGTRADVDGETQLEVSREPFKTILPLVFDGMIVAPNKRVTISDAHLTEYAAMPVKGDKAHVRVWTNDPREPTRILISIE